MSTVDDTARRDIELARLRAEREAAEAARDKARAEAETAEIARDKARAEAGSAEVTRDKAKAELEEWRAHADIRMREAETKAQSARLDAIEKVQARVAAMVPDLSEVERGETTTAKGDVLLAPLLRGRALGNAAAAVAKVIAAQPRGLRVVVTADPDVLRRDAARHALQSRLATLAGLVAETRKAAPGEAKPSLLPERGAEGDGEGGDADGLVLPSGDVLAKPRFVDPVTVAAGLGAAAAKLIPGILSLMAANRSLTTQDLTVEQLSIVNAVAGALKVVESKSVVQIDGMRLLPETSELAKLRSELQEELVAVQAAVATERRKPEASRDAGWLADADAVAEAAREVLASLDAAPSAESGSPMAEAMAVESLRSGGVTGILLVRSEGASAAQLIDDKALRSGDPIHLLASVSISFSLIDTKTSEVVVAGIRSGEAQLTGKIGSRIELG